MANFGKLEDAVRAAAADYTGGKPDEIALTGNTTTGLALLYGGLPLRPRQEIVTTTHDHYVTHEALRLRAVHTGADRPQGPALRGPGEGDRRRDRRQPGQGHRPAHARRGGHLGALVDGREAADPAHGRRARRP